MNGRRISVGLTVLAVLIVAGIVHIASLLAMPQVAPDDAFARIAAYAPEEVVRVLPPAPTADSSGTGRAADGEPVPSRDPSIATAVCRYDLGRGPLRVSAALGRQAFVALSLHSRSGLAFYGLNDRAGNDGKLDLVVMTQAQIKAAEARDGEGTPVRDVRVVAPERQGFVTFDVLPRIGGYPEAERDLASMSCRVER